MASGLLVVALVAGLSAAIVVYEAIAGRRALHMMQGAAPRDVILKIVRVGPTIGMLGNALVHDHVVCGLRIGRVSLGTLRLEFAGMAPALPILHTCCREDGSIALVKDGILYRRELGVAGCAASALSLDSIKGSLRGEV